MPYSLFQKIISKDHSQLCQLKDGQEKLEFLGQENHSHRIDKNRFDKIRNFIANSAVPILIFLPSLFLTGCAASPLALYMAAEGTSIVYTDRTLIDHVSSNTAQKDCSIVRLEQGESYCDNTPPESYLLAPQFCDRSLGTITCYRSPKPSYKQELLEES